MPTTIVGLCLMFLGFVFFTMHQEACESVSELTSDRPDGLTSNELRSKTLQWTKRIKLEKLVAQEPRESELRRQARAALRYEVYGYVAFSIGAALSVCGMLLVPSS